MQRFTLEVDTSHTPQCKCARVWSHFFKAELCSKAHAWLQALVLPPNYRELYFELDSIPLTSTGKMDKKVVRADLDAQGYQLPDLRAESAG